MSTPHGCVSNADSLGYMTSLGDWVGLYALFKIQWGRYMYSEVIVHSLRVNLIELNQKLMIVVGDILLGVIWL